MRRVILLREGAKLPVKKHYTDAGYDCYLCEDVTIPPHSLLKVPLGLAVDILPGEMLSIRSRSSTKVKGVMCADSTCDTGYTGQLWTFLVNVTSEPVSFKKGERVVQLVFHRLAHEPMELTLAPALDSTPRGENGFGSTGRY